MLTKIDDISISISIVFIIVLIFIMYTHPNQLSDTRSMQKKYENNKKIIQITMKQLANNEKLMNKCIKNINNLKLMEKIQNNIPIKKQRKIGILMKIPTKK